MRWVLLGAAILVAAAVLYACVGLHLWRRGAALLREVGTLSERAGELAGLADRVRVPTADQARAARARRTHGGEADPPTADGSTCGGTPPS